MGLRNDQAERSAPRAAGAAVPDRYPARPVKLTLPFPLGGSTGYTATVLARSLEAHFGQPFTVEPRTGNFGINALEHLIAHPGGYTLLVGNLTSNSMTPVFHHDKIGFDYRREISRSARSPISRALR